MAVLQWRLLSAPSSASPSPNHTLSLHAVPAPNCFPFPKSLTLSNIRSPSHYVLSCSSSSEEATSSSPETLDSPPPSTVSPPPRLLGKRVKYRKAYPGENKGLTEELRFVAMRLRNEKISLGSTGFGEPPDDSASKDGGERKGGGPPLAAGIWEPSMEGFLRFLVDIKLVFETLERTVAESDDVSYAYFRKTGLERSSSIGIDLQWFSQKDMVIPEPTNAGLSYAMYLEQLASKSAPLFLSHLYTVYFSHVFGGQEIVRQVAEKFLDGRELEINRFDDDSQVLLKDVRDNINKLAGHWSRGDKNRCLKESAKSYSFLGKIVRLIVSI